jgi:hypothetical protein
MEGEVTVIFENVQHKIDLEDLSSENIGTPDEPILCFASLLTGTNLRVKGIVT